MHLWLSLEFHVTSVNTIDFVIIKVPFLQYVSTLQMKIRKSISLKDQLYEKIIKLVSTAQGILSYRKWNIVTNRYDIENEKYRPSWL